MKRLVVTLLLSLMLITTSCGTLPFRVKGEKRVKETVVTYDIQDDGDKHAELFFIYKDKMYGCSVDYTMESAESLSIDSLLDIDTSVVDATGHLKVTYKKVSVMCAVTSTKPAE